MERVKAEKNMIGDFNSQNLCYIEVRPTLS